MNFENKRQLKRRKLRDEISVSIQRSGSLISGVLLDMTSMGMLILANERLEAFVPIKISIELPNPIQGQKLLLLEGVTKWSKSDSLSKGFMVGLELIVDNSKLSDQLHLFMERYCEI